MTFDDLLTKHLGEFGPYQRWQLFLVGLPVIFTSMHSLSWTFTAATIPHRCLTPGEDLVSAEFFPSGNHTVYSSWLKNTKPWSECERPKGFSLNMTVSEDQLIKWEKESCLDGDIWDTSEIKTTALKKWSFMCKREWLKSTVHAGYYVGQFFGSLIFGIVADKLGRKPVFFVAVAIMFVCGTAMAYVPYWPLFAFLRFMLGFAHPAIFITSVVIAVEMLGPSKRILSPVSACIFFALGQIILACVAYTFRYYHQVQLIISAPVILFVVYFWLLPESARWLISKKKIHRAGEVLEKIAKRNRTVLPQNWHQELEREEKSKSEKNVGFMDMFRTPNVRKHSLTLFVCWPVVSMAYYGLAMNPSFMGGDRYLSMLISGSLEVVVSFILLATVNIVGRKFMAVSGFFLAAICLITSVAIPPSMETLRMIFVALGKMAISAVYAVLYLFTPELFPTVIRMTAVGACSMIARIGGFLAAYVFLWIARFYPTPVALSFSVTCFLACFMLLFLPDTNGQPQIETIEEAEDFAKRTKKIFIFKWNVDNNDKKKVTTAEEMK